MKTVTYKVTIEKGGNSSRIEIKTSSDNYLNGKLSFLKEFTNNLFECAKVNTWLLEEIGKHINNASVEFDKAWEQDGHYEAQY